jgi:pimeloyl-ACP methyl ester carboxylesterase
MVADRGVKLVLTAMVVLLFAACGGTERHAISNGKVEVDGRMLAVHCSGSGSPTVVLEAGAGFSSATWIGVQPRLARRTRVCAYDRLGEGGSDAPRAHEIRTADDQAKTLADMLDSAGIECPCVFVGHSFGGAIILLFASHHREDVAGLVLDDAASGAATRKWLEMLPKPPKNDVDPFRGVRDVLEGSDPLSEPDHVDWGATETQLRNVKSIDAIPLVVLTAAKSQLADELPPPYGKRAYGIWLATQTQLASLSSNSIHAIAQYSGHFIHENQPNVVAAAVAAVVGSVRSDEALPACRALFRRISGVRCVS